MPEVTFRIRWPDGAEEGCYSPSTVIHDHVAAGDIYTVADFLDRSRAGLAAASDRVRARYGHPCGNAAAQLAQIEARASRFDPKEQVLCLSVS